MSTCILSNSHLDFVHQRLKDLNLKIAESLSMKITNHQFIAPFQISNFDGDYNKSDFCISLKHSYDFTKNENRAGYDLLISINYQILIEVSVLTKQNRFYCIDYDLFEQDEMPEDKKEYVEIMSKFLFGLIRWGSSLAYDSSSYHEMVPSCYENKDFPFQYFSPETAQEDMIMHKYNWKNKKELKSMIDVWDSKDFKISRASYDSWRDDFEYSKYSK